MSTSRRSFIMRSAVAAAGVVSQSEGSWAANRSEGDLLPAEKEAMASEATGFMNKYQVPGLSVAIARRGRLVYSEPFGSADLEQQKLTAKHRFRIASLSKPITSVAIMGLIEQSKLSLSDRVFGKRGVLGSDFGTQLYSSNVENITIEHLLTHTAGGWGNEGPDRDPMFTNSRMNQSQLISWTLDNIPLRNAPGSSYSYSNFGYCLLGRVIEKRTNQSYAAYVREHVLRRCGIAEMEIAGNLLADRKPNEVEYIRHGNSNPYGMQVVRMDSHGGWIATPTDLVRFLVCVDGFDSSPDILKPDTIKSMIAPSPVNTGYAKGWNINKQGNWWHMGSLIGTTSVMVRTSSGFCWAALANTRQFGGRMDSDFDRLIWTMVGKVSHWPNGEPL